MNLVTRCVSEGCSILSLADASGYYVLEAPVDGWNRMSSCVENLADHVAMHVRQSAFDAVVVERQPLVVDPQ